MPSHLLGRCALVAATAASLLTLAPAAGAAPRGRVIHRPPSAEPTAHAHLARTIYVNRCADGCTVTPGFPDDSVANVSSIVQQTSNLSAFRHGDDVWRRMVECVRFVYAPYGIEVVDEDPSPVPHFEAIAAGTSDQAGFDPAEVGGVGVGGCGEVADNSISFTFANILPADPTLLCYVVAQETAHNFGLDHELEPSDPLTYLPYDGLHLFADKAVDCGEDVPRSCCAGPSQQNSHQYILDLFGPGAQGAEPIELRRPLDGSSVAPGFAIEVGAGTYVESLVVELDGEVLVESTLKPFIFNAPADLPAGPLTVEVTSVDARGASSTATATVTVTEGGADGDGESGAGGGGAGPGGLGLGLAFGAALAAARRRRSAVRPG